MFSVKAPERRSRVTWGLLLFNLHQDQFSTYDVVYANDTLRSIFSAALGDLYEKYKSICNQDATDSIIAPLVEKYGDRSNGGMVTYRKVYKKMGEMSPIN